MVIYLNWILKQLRLSHLNYNDGYSREEESEKWGELLFIWKSDFNIQFVLKFQAPLSKGENFIPCYSKLELWIFNSCEVLLHIS